MKIRPLSRRRSRRRFLQSMAAIPAVSVLPRHLLAGSGQVPPSDRLNVAVIGTGGQGITLLKELIKHPDVNVTALCDVAEFWDNSHLYYRHHGGRGPARMAIEEHRAQAGKPGQHASAVYVDFRVMLERACWRWEILHLRTVLDGERFAGAGLATRAAEAAMLRLMERYHCQMETDDPYHHRVRPPLKRAVSRRGES